ncbi:MAG: molybdenum cofactor guanylyltransferase, partial [Actinobacteria bacterium]|nr:molybdenum cofactor guanylyltransferase [Actinomycetota bacterium]
AVLTGGASRRMGRDKALIQIEGVRMVDRVAAALAAAGCSNVVAVGPRKLAGDLAHIDDLYPGEGPLGGVLTAMASMGSVGSWLCVVACDLPWLDVDSIDALHRAATSGAAAGRNATEVDVVVARTDRVEPLCALWNQRCREAVQQAFDSGQRSVLEVFKALNVIEVPVHPNALRNVNTPEDLPTS